MPRVTIPIGPAHPSLKEPESFNITLEGERIFAAEVKLGYNHRGIEKAAEARTYVQDIHLIERVCGICSHAHSTAFCLAVEEVAGLTAPPRAQHVRTLVAELERIHSHLLWLGVAGHEIGFDTLLMYTWRDREPVMDLLALLTGNRVNYGINCIGGVRRDVTPDQLGQVLAAIGVVEERVRYYAELAATDPTLRQRLQGVGHLSRQDAVRLGTVGPTARASGIDRDTRRDDPYLAYGQVEFDVITSTKEDVLGRTEVRVGELLQSCRIIRQLAASMPDGPLTVKAPRKVPAGEALVRYEAPRGENVHVVRGNGTDRPERVKVRAPTLANTASVARMMEKNYLADVPIIVAAIDPCFSCTDRAIRVSGAGPEAQPATWKGLRQAGIERYAREGVDFTAHGAALERRLGPLGQRGPARGGRP